MALTFEYTKAIDTGSQPFISAEKDSMLYNYYIDNELAMDKSATAAYGNYDTVDFVDEDRHLTTKAVSRIGIKNFPGIGAIGFYKDAYSDDSFVVAPVHAKRDRRGIPTLAKVEIVDNKLHIVITPPEGIKYNVYRVIVRQGTFAFEYILYKTDYYVDKPTVKGEYILHCVGYDEDMGTVSEDSNALALTVDTGSPDWNPDSIDMTDIDSRLTKIEEEIQNYPDEEISEGISNILGGENSEVN